MNKEITVIVNGKPKQVKEGVTLSDIIDQEKQCGGHGKCGKCKVIAKGELSELTDSELKLLTKKQLSLGMRLSCMTYALGDCEITTLADDENARIVTDGKLPEFDIKPDFDKYGVAIDIGTTTLAAQIYDNTGKMLADTARLNPQQKWGADVVTRIEAALSGKACDLANEIRSAIENIISELSGMINIDAKEIDGIVITGNTVMLSLLTKQSTEPFSHAPFEAERLFGEDLRAKELGLTNLADNTSIYLPPCISSFVGADAVCAILSTRIYSSNCSMMVDIGTNGEMALWHNGKLAVCSTAAGPAFEGVGISMGMRGANGAIDRVYIDNGELKAHVIGDGAPTGICGSGLVDTVACLLELGVIDESGYLEDDEFIISTPVCITPKDIRMLQLAKSAICAGIETLIIGEGISDSDIQALYVAGGFGNFLNKQSAAKIGLLPKGISKNITAVGNAALAGAAMMLLNGSFKKTAKEIAMGAITLDLSADPVFSEKFMSGMIFEGGDNNGF
ncbi:MAG: DUF4445 domain-containing protein [Clostridia bacterium]|nr:DUF4445 domain-containing protein [Clostridia bacterium]